MARTRAAQTVASRFALVVHWACLALALVGAALALGPAFLNGKELGVLNWATLAAAVIIYALGRATLFILTPSPAPSFDALLIGPWEQQGRKETTGSGVPLIGPQRRGSHAG